MMQLKHHGIIHHSVSNQMLTQETIEAHQMFCQLLSKETTFLATILVCTVQRRSQQADAHHTQTKIRT